MFIARVPGDDQSSSVGAACSGAILGGIAHCHAAPTELGWISGGHGRYKHGAPNGASSAFTLIELLVVIAIIALLSGLVVALLPRAQDFKIRSRVKAERAQMETAIENYHAKRGFYPPDNPSNPGSNSLYYELSGTTFDSKRNEYATLSGDGPLPAGSVLTAFGAGGFVNANSPANGGADDAKNFHPALKLSQQVREVTVNGVNVKLMGVATKGPGGDFCPWLYNSSNPTHNPSSYDLWVDVIVSGRTNSFGNWKQD